MDKRKFNKGTIGNKGGRPSKAEELKAMENGIEAIIEVYGSIKEYWKHIAILSKDSFQYTNLLQQYIYGKARETKDISIDNLNSREDTISKLMAIPEDRYNEIYKIEIDEGL